MRVELMLLTVRKNFQVPDQDPRVVVILHQLALTPVLTCPLALTSSYPHLLLLLLLLSLFCLAAGHSNDQISFLGRRMVKNFLFGKRG